MVSLQKIESSRLTEVYPLLRELDPQLSQDHWRKLFSYQWNQPSNYCGYGLFDDGTAVGFLGLIFSHRQIANQKELFCNLTSWVVRPDYRSHSLSLMMPVMRLKDHTITDLSATAGVAKLSERLGFQPLDTTVRVLFPYGMTTVNQVRLYSDDEIAILPLESSELAVFADHQPHAHCRQLVLHTDQGYCHVLYTLNMHPKLSYCHIQSISNAPLFERHQAIIRRRIIRDTGIRLIIIDSRLVAPIKLPFSCQIRLRTPRLYRSQQLQPAQIDNAYSELVLLGLNTDFDLPGFGPPGYGPLGLGLRQQLVEAFTPWRRWRAE
jgi:hypothetical protein